MQFASCQALQRNRRKRPTGFTLVNVLVAVLLLALLLAIAMPLYQTSQSNAKMQACEEDMAAIFQAEEAYRARNRAYLPSTDPSYTSTIGPALAGLPKCPSGTTGYTVTTSGSGSTLTLTITCPNKGAHVAGKNLVTTDGVTFTAQ